MHSSPLKIGLGTGGCYCAGHLKSNVEFCARIEIECTPYFSRGTLILTQFDDNQSINQGDSLTRAFSNRTINFPRLKSSNHFYDFCKL